MKEEREDGLWDSSSSSLTAEGETCERLMAITKGRVEHVGMNGCKRKEEVF